MARRALVTGATGFVGGRLAAALADRGWAVRCLVRDRSRAQGLADRGFELHEADVLDPEALRGAGEGVEVAYYLIHAMGRGTARAASSPANTAASTTRRRGDSAQRSSARATTPERRCLDNARVGGPELRGPWRGARS